MSIVWTILIGLAVGVVARLLHPGKENMGMIVTLLLGIAGSVVARYAGQLIGWYQPGEPAGFIGSVVVAIVLLFVYAKLQQKPRDS